MWNFWRLQAQNMPDMALWDAGGFSLEVNDGGGGGPHSREDSGSERSADE